MPRSGGNVKSARSPCAVGTYAEVMSGPQGVNGERGSVAAVQSVDRALSVLEILAAHGEAGVTDVAAELGVHKSTAFRLIAVLESRGFVEQLADRGKYRLGFGVVRLAGAAAAQLDIAQEGRRICEALAADVEETVNIAILDSDRAVNVSQVRGPAALSTHNWVGQGTPLHATSSGKVLLAHAADAVRKGVLSRDLQRFTPATITDPEVLRQHLDRIVEQGWGSTVEEYEVGLSAVAAPVRGADGDVIAALSVSGPLFRMEAERFPRLARRVMASADELSRRLGFFS
ncbi:transcriptional regulator, IclR family [Blastococcus mobilis]|uniref:Glycerol operon regulatory protein n=2 Tax=Blastococcus mobilis TaxID=1938746 RepID=A0A238WVS1_9ACTN|nr:transcriptional regulator, IclR family [Blastococcus mobilis]